MKKKNLILTIFAITGLAAFLWSSVLAAPAFQAGPPYFSYLPIVSKPEPTPTPIPPAPPTVFSTTRYMTSITNVDSYNFGCLAGQRDLALPGKQDSLIILAYGQPWGQNGEYGVWYYRGTFANTTQIGNSAKQYAKGYWDCSGNDNTSTVEIAIGTSNYASYYNGVCTSGSWFCTTDRAYNHGKEWALMVKDVYNWVISQGYASQISVAGGNDIEFLWNKANITKSWVEGFDDYDQGVYKFYNFGSCDACPYVGSTWHPPANNWSMEDAYYVAWGAAPVHPVPEIYSITGKNAKEWAYLSYWGTQNNRVAIQFPATLTQWQACQQVGGCTGSDNKPLTGWQQLFTEINRWPQTAQQNIRWMTDILWSNYGVPAPP
ncbi:MAG: hypothetical protein CVU39_23330 [Chloroflexi bacterium HGW-Chloroflexi-10]|nr:MAG: hypothetical protein CVU39_23330 [Chloroflexi bacterium HGW-Chloroflexi-10]